MLLAGDVGGTKTDLAVFAQETGPHMPLAQASYPSSDYDSLEAIVREYLAKVRLPVRSACFGVAGPVVAGKADITNLSWMIDGERIAERFGLSHVVLINDLNAIAEAIPILEPDDRHMLSEGVPDPAGAIAVIAPGTGLGEAYLTFHAGHYHAHASEGGHVDFAPTTPLEVELLLYLRGRLDHVSYERLCSGIGIPNIYSFLRDSAHAREPEWLAESLRTAEDPTPVIVKAALSGAADCRLCQATLELFVSILGSEAGNLALKVLATGGVFLAGGIPPRILPALSDGRFLEAFRRKGRMASLLAEIPVGVILNAKAALLGAARRGLALTPA